MKYEFDKRKTMKIEHILIGLVAVLVVVSGFQFYSISGLSKKSSIQSTTAMAVAPLQPARQVQLPENIKSSAPIQFKSFEEEAEYYKKNTKNPNNVNIEQAIKNMDKNLDGQCDTCGMAILHCIEMGMEDM